jgi:hypothetical protein
MKDHKPEDKLKSQSPDFGPMSVTQIAHVAKALLPVVHLLQGSLKHSIPISPYLETFHSAIRILRDLRPRFDSVVRDLDPTEEYARKLGVPLPESSTLAGGPATTDPQLWASEANVDPGLIDTVTASLLSEGDVGNSASGQGRQTSGSGAIQALLSLSGRAKNDATASSEGLNGTVDEQATSAEGLNAWWASVLSGTLEGQGQTEADKYA